MPMIILCSLLVAGAFLIAFIFATRKGQYDDVATPAIRMMFDDEPAESSRSNNRIK